MRRAKQLLTTWRRNRWKTTRVKPVSLVVNCNKSDRAIGVRSVNRLLYKTTSDMKHFKRLTTHSSIHDSKIYKKRNAIIMGTNTYRSMSSVFPLPNRFNIVVGSSYVDIPNPISGTNNNHAFVRTVEDALLLVNKMKDIDDVYVIGGAQIYRYFLDNELWQKTYMVETEPYTPFPGKGAPTILYQPDDLVKFPELENPIVDEYDRTGWKRDNIVDVCQISSERVEHEFQVYKSNVNPDEYQYLDALRNVLDNGDVRQTRNGVVHSLFGDVKIQFDLSHGYPLLTTKRVWGYGVATELWWMLNGYTDAKILQYLGNNIWTANSSKEQLQRLDLGYEEGECGPIYGCQWRGSYSEDPRTDQVARVINDIKTDPYSRRLIVNGWNVSHLHRMCLPPCHVLYQFYVSSDNRLSCQMYQRSADMFLGLPFNIASTALFTHLIAHQTGLTPGKISICVGDAHIYGNHVDQVRTQLDRVPLRFPKLKIVGQPPRDIGDYTFDHIKLSEYFHLGGLKADMSA